MTVASAQVFLDAVLEQTDALKIDENNLINHLMIEGIEGSLNVGISQ